MRVLAVLLLLATTAAPAQAADYWIGTYIYTIPGADMRATVYCQDDQRVFILEFTATDGKARTYWVDVDTDAPGMTVSHVGLVRVEGIYISWLPHGAGDRATVVISGDPCWHMVPDVRPAYRLWLPVVVK